jgi:murein DD-endopeptidase MepM/ murein hydrolase activator NlpD
MARHQGKAATTAYVIVVAALALATPAAAQSTGGVSPGSTAPTAAPRLTGSPPGVVKRPAPQLRSWRCVRPCTSAQAATTGAMLRIRGRALARAYEVVFLGAEGPADDVAAVPVRRKRNVVDFRVPLAAVSGPLLVTDRDGLTSKPSAVPFAFNQPLALKRAGGPPTVEVQTHARRAFFDAAQPAEVSYIVHGDTAASVVVELLRAKDGAVVTSWPATETPPETPQTVTWDGTVGGKLAASGVYTFRVSAVNSAGLRAVSAQAPEATEPNPAAFRFLKHEFPIRGPHVYGTGAATFGGGRGHQGFDTFAACGTPLWAARGGKVEFKEYHARAGHYLVIDGERTGVDYTYMHLRSAALVDVGDRVRTGQLIGYVGQTGDASGCHLHFEMWTAPGWYDGGHPFDPLPSLLAWDKTS